MDPVEFVEMDHMKSSLIYLASPYSHPSSVIREQRFDQVCRIAAKLMTAGIKIFCPIAHTHPINERGIGNPGWDFWKNYDIIMLSKCDGIMITTMHGWKESVGVNAEIAFMKEQGKPIWYLEPGDPLILGHKEPEE